jgi:hypothetical protein
MASALLAALVSIPGWTQVQPDSDADGVRGAVPRIGRTCCSPVPLATGRLLIDRSHGELADITAFTDTLASHGWTITTLDTGPVTQTLLARHDVFVVLPAYQGIAAFTPAEASEVAEYVGNGGGLWLLHEFFRDPAGVNSLASQFGVTFHDDRVEDPTGNRGEIFWPTISDLAADPITQGISSFGYYAGACLTVTAPASVLARGDMDAGSQECASQPAVLAVARVGRGCVVFSGDVTPLHPSYYPDALDAQEELLLMSIVDHLASGRISPVRWRTWGAVKAGYR